MRITGIRVSLSAEKEDVMRVKRQVGVTVLVYVLCAAAASAADLHSRTVRAVPCASSGDIGAATNIDAAAPITSQTDSRSMSCREFSIQPTPTARMPKPGRTSLKAWLIAGVVVGGLVLLLYASGLGRA